MAIRKLRVLLIKASKYGTDGFVERFRRGFMPNSTLAYIKSLTPSSVDGVPTEVIAFDEYIHARLDYLCALRKQNDAMTLLAIVGVQSHQFQRALDLAAYAKENGVEHCVIGGPHPMTCDTTFLQGRGVSFSMAEAESAWPCILSDAVNGELAPFYGKDMRWKEVLDPPVLQPFSRKELRRYAVPLLGIYPARGCPYNCNFCSVIKIAGRQIRSQPVETTVASLFAARAGGVRMVMFTSDNFNKYPHAVELLTEMIREKIRVPFFVQCDAQVYKQPELVELLGQAGCFQMFVGVESFSRQTLKAAQKFQNQPEHYAEIVALCRSFGITSHFSNILGFPTDDERIALEHLRILKSLRPDVASFYILTPIPGTQQYDEFLKDDLIFESNLDRFDGTHMTWRHPNLTNEKLRELLTRCYEEFFNSRDVLLKLAGLVRRSLDYRAFASLVAVPGYSIQSRIAIRKNHHPMSGGVLRVRLDKDTDYADARRRVFGIARHPLPQSLHLSAAEQAINSRGALLANA